MKRSGFSTLPRSSFFELFLVISNDLALLMWPNGAASLPVFHLPSALSTAGAVKKRTCWNVRIVEKFSLLSYPHETTITSRRKSTISWPCSSLVTQTTVNSPIRTSHSSFWRKTTHRICSKNAFKPFPERSIFYRRLHQEYRKKIWTFWADTFLTASKIRWERNKSNSFSIKYSEITTRDH